MIEGAILNGLADVPGLDGTGTGEVGDGAGQLEHPMTGAGGEPEPVDGRAQQASNGGGLVAMAPQLSSRHVGVGMQAPLRAESLPLARARGLDPGTNGGAGLGGSVVRQLAIRQRRHSEVHVDPVEQRPREPGAVTLDLRHAAAAGTRGVAEVPARTTV